MVVIIINNTRGAFFLRDKMPLSTNEKIINGRIKISTSLKSMLKVYIPFIKTSGMKLPKSRTKIIVNNSWSGKDKFIKVTLICGNRQSFTEKLIGWFCAVNQL